MKKESLLVKQLRSVKRKGKTIGFVPTMGYLHEGHLSLVRKAKKENDVVVVSIFVNPLQFAPQEDYKTYPRDLKRDARLLRGLCDFLFVPAAQQLYPRDFCTSVNVKALSDHLCGHSRKGHFIGVTTIVCKLFNIVMPDCAYFGQKDMQQALIIQRMVKDLNYSIVVKVLPIMREKDGLAMSSRNAYLTKAQRQDAVVLFQALRSAQRLVSTGLTDAEKIKTLLRDFVLRNESMRIDYIEIVDKTSLEPVKRLNKDVLLALAVYVGKVRLIDNTILKV
ncbi:MAG: pantoate--beta-alanine ligase [Candidatus Omnitrophota bacterium]